MDRALGSVVVTALVLGLLAGPVLARQDEDDVKSALDDLKRQVGELNRENDAMQKELDELRAINSDEWLTEQRADEIRGLVQDVLADADLRASLLGNGITAGWDDNFFLESADGRFRLQLDGQLQTRFVFSYHDADDKYRYGFEISRAKLTFRGHVFGPDIEYLIRMDATRNEPMLVTGLEFLQDAWVRWRMTNEWSVRFGQFKLPFMREELVSSAYQLAVERSLVAESYSVARSQGIELTSVIDTQRWSVALSDGGTDQLGGFNVLVGTLPLNSPALILDTEWAVTGRYELKIAGNWKQFDDFTSPPGDEFGMLWGIAGHAQQGESDGIDAAIRNESLWLAWTTDISVEWGGANMFASFTHEYVESPLLGRTNFNVFGITLQGGFYVTPKLELFGRWEYGWWEQEIDELTALNFSDMSTITLGLNYYIQGHDLKWTTDIGFGLTRIGDAWASDIAGYRIDPEDANPQIVFRTQLQLLF